MGVEVETITAPPNPEDKPVKGSCYFQIVFRLVSNTHKKAGDIPLGGYRV